MPYCPYTDADVSANLMNEEHVIPKSLGGADGFTIQVSSSLNSQLGGAVDGAMANDLSMLMRREILDARGHSKKVPRPTVRRASLGDGTPVQATLSKVHGLEVWSARERRTLSQEEIGGQSVKIAIDVSTDAPVSFLGKVVLGSGHFAFGESFSKDPSVSEIRWQLTPADERGEPPTTRKIRIDCAHLGMGTDFPNKELYEDLCSILTDSCVVILVGDVQVQFIVGILGRYFGAAAVEMDTGRFPRTGQFSGGHVIQCRNGRCYRASFDRFAEIVSERSK